MNIFVYLFISILGVDGSGKSCDDIDHEACIAMAKQNSVMCSDSVLATSVCPNFCNHCPITCYNCNVSTPDVSSCNTKTCDGSKVCMIKEVNSVRTGDHRYTLGCETTAVCDGERKRSLQSRSVYIDCCQDDLCNNPTLTSIASSGTVTTISLTTTVPVHGHSTTTSRQSHYGQICTSNKKCVFPHTMCLHGHCDCVPGYVHEPMKGTCVTNCSRYGSTYIVYTNVAMNTRSIEYFQITLHDCKNHCSNLPSCRGFNYFPYNGGQCRLVSDTPHTQPHYYVYNSGVDFYIRNCS